MQPEFIPQLAHRHAYVPSFLLCHSLTLLHLGLIIREHPEAVGKYIANYISKRFIC